MNTAGSVAAAVYVSLQEQFRISDDRVREPRHLLVNPTCVDLLEEKPDAQGLFVAVIRIASRAVDSILEVRAERPLSTDSWRRQTPVCGRRCSNRPIALVPWAISARYPLNDRRPESIGCPIRGAVSVLESIRR